MRKLIGIFINSRIRLNKRKHAGLFFVGSCQKLPGTTGIVAVLKAADA